jgi:hypothetical protein
MFSQVCCIFSQICCIVSQVYCIFSQVYCILFHLLNCSFLDQVYYIFGVAGQVLLSIWSTRTTHLII